MATCDTSFLCALYFAQIHSKQALEWYSNEGGNLLLTDLVLMEYRQSIRFQSWLFHQDRQKGISEIEGVKVLQELELHLSQKKFQIVHYQWSAVVREMERISDKYTTQKGGCLFDLLLVACTLSLGDKEFLTFDQKQREIAESEGLIVPF